MAAQREWFEKDYYQVLGVADDADAEGHHQGLPQAGRELHPDNNPGDPNAEERFKEVCTAYDVLGDEAKRKEYDEVRRLGPDGRRLAGGGGPGGCHASTSATCRRRPRRPARPDVRARRPRRRRIRRWSARSAAPTSKPS